MLSVLVCGILVASTSAGTPCCIDRKFEARMGEVGVVYSPKMASQSQGENVIHYDFYSRKLMVEATLNFTNGSSLTTNVVVDDVADEMFVLTKDGCFKSKNTIPFLKSCIPDDAVKVRESYIGSGVSSIPFTTWQFLVPGSGNVIRLSVTDKGCIPIFESLFGTIQGGSADILYILTNFQPGIRKPDVFLVPDNCKPLPSNDVPDVVRRSINKAERLAKHFMMDNTL